MLRDDPIVDWTMTLLAMSAPKPIVSSRPRREREVVRDDRVEAVVVADALLMAPVDDVRVDDGVLALRRRRCRSSRCNGRHDGSCCRESSGCRNPGACREFHPPVPVTCGAPIVESAWWIWQFVILKFDATPFACAKFDARLRRVANLKLVEGQVRALSALERPRLPVAVKDRRGRPEPLVEHAGLEAAERLRRVERPEITARLDRDRIPARPPASSP
jgi:hypothetical protein